ncbi:hypothetical protein ACFL52_04215 [Candidatus Margulisiibacteriota bacterium]
MVREKITLEVAGVPFSVAAAWLPSDFYNFQSDSRPKFSINTLPGERAISVEDDDFDVDFFEEDRKVYYFVKGRPDEVLGYFSRKDKQALFFHSDEKTTRLCFSPFIRSVLQLNLFGHHGFIMHACAVADGDKGFLFIGPSGAGKSTVANMSTEKKVLSDEFVCVRKIKDEYFLYSTPWRGEMVNGMRLTGIYFLKKAKEFKLEEVGAAEALQSIMPNILHSYYDGEIMGKILGMLKDLTKNIFCRNMHFALDSKIWEGLSVAA